MLAASIFFGAGIVSVAGPIGASPVAAAPPTPVLVDDVNETSRGSSISNMIVVDNVLLFTADNGVTGVELWRYTGTGAPTLVDDINPEGSSSPSDLTDVGGVLYFTADNGADGREPYYYDPSTPAVAPAQVADIAAGADSSNASDFVAFDAAVWFVADDVATGPQLFRASDPAAPGLPAAVTTTFGGDTLFAPTELVVVTDPLVGPVLWVAGDADQSGLGDLVGFDANGGEHVLAVDEDPSDLIDVAGTLYFNNDSLVVVDLVSEVPVEFAATPLTGVGLVDLYTAGGDVFASNGVNLSRYDGASLVSVGIAPGDLTPAVEVGGDLVYADVAGASLWRTNGAGAVSVFFDENAELNQPSVIAGPWVAAGNVFVVGSDGVSLELWVTDGTPAGTFVLADLDVFLGTDVGGFVSFAGTIHFWGDLGTTGVELLETSEVPTAGDVTLVADIVTGTDGSLPDSVSPVADRIVWSATSGVVADAVTGALEFEPYVYDPAIPLVQRLVDINVGPGSSHPRGFTRLGDLTIFQADDGVNGAELWVTDGTAAGTQMIQINPGPTGAFGLTPQQFDGFVVIGDTAYFAASGAGANVELWKTDGTAAGTQLVRDVRAGVNPSNPRDLVVMGGTLYFIANTGSGVQVWRSDGTLAGTTVVAPVTNVSNLAAGDGYVVFVVDGVGGRVPWVSDGTSTGTTPLQAPGADPEAFLAGEPRFTAVGLDVWFFAANSLTGEEGIWKTDGTSDGTFEVYADPFFVPYIGDDLDVPAIAPVGNGQVLFGVGTDTALGDYVLWQSDGSPVGTTGPVTGGYNVPIGYAALNGWTYFTAATPSTGRELWRSNGPTVEQVTNFGGAADGVDTNGLWPAGDRLFFPGITPTAGTELWYVADVPSVPATPAAPTAAAGVNSVTVSWTSVADQPGAPVTGYTVAATPGGATCTGDETDTSCTISGLNPATAYTFTVRATNRIGDSELSPASSSVQPLAPAVPNTPTAPTATAGLQSATITWSAVADPVGAPVTGYTVVATPGGATCSTSGATSCTVTGLTAGIAHTFRVRATNSVGDSALSPASNSVVPTSSAPVAPNAPAAPTATAGVQSATVSWTAVPNPIGAPVTGYTVVASNGGGTCTTSGATSCTVTGLTAGTSYSFRVRATNSVGDSNLSPSSNTVTPTAPAPALATPNAPAAPTAVAKVRSAQVSWTAVPDPSGAPVTGYTVTAAPGGATCNVPAAATSCIVGGLTAGTSYTFTVVATNSAGNSASSPASAAVVPVPPQSVPLTPARLMDSRIGAAFLTVDGQAQGTGEIAAGTTYELVVADRGGVAANADAVMLNVTAVGPASDGFLTLYPCGTDRPLTSSVNYQAGEVVPNAVLAKIGTGGTVCIFTLATTHVLVDVSGFVPAGGSPSTVVPARLLETRTGDDLKTVDGAAQGVGRQAAGSTYELVVTGRGNVPAGAEAVMLNVTAVAPSGDGFLTLYPCGTDRPLASSVNYKAGEVVPNAVLAKIGTGGKVCIFTLAEADLLVDVSGFVPAGGSPSTVLPARLLETRIGDDLKTVDGVAQGVGRQAAGSTFELQVTGRGNVPADATAVMLNVTAVLPDSGGFLTVFPCGADRPLTSSVNYGPGEVVPNAVLAKIGTGGKVCIFTTAATDLLVDVNAAIVPV